MNKAEVVRLVSHLKFKQSDFWIVAGSAMCIYDLRAYTNDVDLGCTTDLANELEKNGYTPVYLKDGTRKFIYSNDIEIFENFLFDKVVFVEGLPVISLTGLLEMKRFLGREKDCKDIELIESYLNQEKG